MKWQQPMQGIARGKLIYRSRITQSFNGLRSGIPGIALGILSSLLPQERCVAQSYLRLSDPHTMTRAKQTVKAGRFQMDSLTNLPQLSEAIIYVPPKCVGTQPCPLIITFATGAIIDSMIPAMDEFGIILLAVEGASNTGEDSIMADYKRNQRHFVFNNLETALKQAFAKFAIDPDKIAIMGRCFTGLETTLWAPPNSGLFSHVILNSTGWWAYPRLPVDSSDKKTQVLITSGIEEEVMATDVTHVQALMHAGHPVKQILGLRGHEHQIEDYHGIARWLHDSWVTPNPKARPAPQVIAGPLPVLTPQALDHMITFWTLFQQEPDSIRTYARRAHLREVAIPATPESPVSVWMVDMAALAAQCPAVAADLKKAGLTAQEHDAYRLALITAQYVRPFLQPGAAQTSTVAVAVQIVTKAVAANPVLRQNVDFLDKHPDELSALFKTRMWSTP